MLDALSLKPVSIDTLDNKKVFVSPTDVVTPQTEIRIPSGGMPCAPTGNVIADTTTQLKDAASTPKGDLIVKFNIEFPKRV